MTVEELIEELKKLPQDAEVHRVDNMEWEPPEVDKVTLGFEDENEGIKLDDIVVIW